MTMGNAVGIRKNKSKSTTEDSKLTQNKYKNEEAKGGIPLQTKSNEHEQNKQENQQKQEVKTTQNCSENPEVIVSSGSGQLETTGPAPESNEQEPQEVEASLATMALAAVDETKEESEDMKNKKKKKKKKKGTDVLVLEGTRENVALDISELTYSDGDTPYWLRSSLLSDYKINRGYLSPLTRPQQK